MYGKLENGNLVIAPRKLSGDGVTVYNPPVEMYADQGWKPLTYTEPPTPPEGYYYESGWHEESAELVQTWTLVELPDDIDEVEAWGIIFGEGDT